ncbi:MAG: DUF3108 domain-containing protein [Rubrimonas sp.]
MRKTGMALTIALAVGAGGAAGTASDAATGGYQAVYDVFLGGLRGGELRLEVDRDGDRYAAQGALRASGIAAWFLPGQAEARAEGQARSTAYRPDRFEADAAFGRTRQFVAFDYEGPAVRMTAEPPLRERPYNADPARMGDALDPLSAAVAVMAPTPVAEACGRTIPVFDSRRRYDFVLGPAVSEGDGLRCEGRFRRVAGFKRIDPDNDFTVWWRVQDGMAVMERAQAATGFGYAVARLR